MSRKAEKGGTERPTVAVARSSKDRLVEWLEKNDSPEQGRILGKLIDWFVDQPFEVRAVVLGQVPERLASAYAGALRTIADEVEKGLTSASLSDRPITSSGQPAPVPAPHGRPARQQRQ